MKRITDMEIIAHRGGANPHIENTLDSFLYGIKLGFKAIEMDVRYAYIRKKFFLEHDFLHHPKFRKNYLESIIPKIPNKISLFVELKTNCALTNIFARNFNNIYLKHLKNRKTWIISFNPFVLIRLKRLNPDMPIGFVCGNRFFKWLFHLIIYPILKPKAYVISKRFLNKRTVMFAKRHGMQIYAYVINRSDDRYKALDLDIDGIITDYPI